MTDKGQNKSHQSISVRNESTRVTDFVLEKSIFSNIFEKDIQRVFIYKKIERLAKAVHLILPAFSGTPTLKDKISGIAVALVDGALVPPVQARETLGRELLALSSVLSIARAANLLSAMNADLIGKEVANILQEIASYEEPRLLLEEAPTLAGLAKEMGSVQAPVRVSRPVSVARTPSESPKNQVIKDNSNKGRRDAVLSIIRDKGTVGIKDISTLIRDVSEKTVQRELQALIEEGIVRKTGERRWSSYSLA